MLNVGDKAPDFTLMAYDRSMVTLSEHTGNRIILAFYPAAFTEYVLLKYVHFLIH